MASTLRFITATSLFDGHDAAIHMIRRLLQSQGVEVIHLGHNRSVSSIVKAAMEEDVNAIAVSSYQGGHVEYFTYMLDLLKKNNASHIKIFAGGGGVISPSEILLLEERGVAKIFSPHDGFNLGLTGMIKYMINACVSLDFTAVALDKDISRNISIIEFRNNNKTNINKYDQPKILREKRCPILGFSGTGGAGKSSLIDEIVGRFLRVFKDKSLAIISIDPTRIKTKGALLGDRIRFNNADNDRVFFRSMATKEADKSLSSSLSDVLAYLSRCHFDLVIFESAGIGQGDRSIIDLCDLPIYVMTPDFGSRSQLEKIAMLDAAKIVVINKFDRSGALDALREVKKAYQRNHQLFDEESDNMPVYGTCAHIFNDLGTNRLFNKIFSKLANMDQKVWHFTSLKEGDCIVDPLIPKKRGHYLAEITNAVRHHHKYIANQADILDKIEALHKALEELPEAQKIIANKINDLTLLLDDNLLKDIDDFAHRQKSYSKNVSTYKVRGHDFNVDNFTKSLSHILIPKIKCPDINNRSDIARFLGKENLPGYFPFTAGVFPFKRLDEDPTRMFAGEGIAERTNKRFHYLSKQHEAKRLSTAFDSPTLYGEDPDLRPDILGKIGNAGVSVCSLDDVKRLYSGFDLTSNNTSVSMTINGPAPTILAFFFNAAIDFFIEKELKNQGKYQEVDRDINNWFLKNNFIRPKYRFDLPDNHDGSGLLFLGVSADKFVAKDLYEECKKKVLSIVRGTIQADILKEDQAQNTCIFSTEFSMRMMGDIQEYFIAHNITNFYSVSISGYHIAEAGANPISQLAFTLANGFTLLEYYISRGMHVDDFAKNFSFFFSNGLDAEYSVIGRVARRIWAIALKNIYKANERSQKLKYHIQTSGRSLHSQEMTFNDIRTTLQALYATVDNCNSLHTNAFDEAITTPTENSVRKAVAIQLIINKELGITKNENPWQGSYFINYLTDQVEEAVLKMMDNIDDRGGVFGAMETMYQRSVIQDESLLYEKQKLSGELPIVGVNTFLHKEDDEENINHELMRSSEEEKMMQVYQIEQRQKMFLKEREIALQELNDAAFNKDNVFSKLIEASKYCSLGEISKCMFLCGGAYRRNI